MGLLMCSGPDYNGKYYLKYREQIGLIVSLSMPETSCSN